MSKVIEFPSNDQRCRAVLDRWLKEGLSSRPGLLEPVSAQLLPIFDAYVLGTFSVRLPEEYRGEVAALVEQFSERSIGLFLEVAKLVVQAEEANER